MPEIMNREIAPTQYLSSLLFEGVLEKLLLETKFKNMNLQKTFLFLFFYYSHIKS